MGRASRRLLLGAGAIAAVGILLTLGVVAQIDSRNTSDEYFDAVNGAACYEHHIDDGFSPFGWKFDEAYSQLPVGETVPINVTVTHNTRYTEHDLMDISVTVNREEAPNVQVVTDDLPDPIEQAWGPESLSDGDGIESGDVYIGAGAFEGKAIARVVSTDPPIHQVGVPGTLTLDADGEEVQSDDGSVSVELGEQFFQQRGRGNYSFAAAWDSPDALLPVTAEVEMLLWVNFTQEATEFTFNSDAFLRNQGAQATVTIPVRITSEEGGLLDFRVRAMTFWEHQPQDDAYRDDGEYLRFMTMEVEGGDELIVARQVGAPTPVGDVVNLYNMLTRLLGFIGLFLVAAAMFTGGVFGKGSRRWMNRFTGGAKKRVLWHSAMGFLIVVVATVHFSLALVESLHDFSKGLLWGGLAWVLLISLGFTGYYQVRMIKKWNYRVWRHVHLWSAVAVLLFVLMHALLDGSDFSAVRELLPSGYDKLIWPRGPGASA